MRRSLMLLVLASCATSPATHSPLRDQLAAADTSKIEEAARACLAKSGWKVDPVGGLSASGWNVINASKAKVATEVFVQEPGALPRVTGGPDYDDVFWTCLGRELGAAKGAPTSPDSP